MMEKRWARPGERERQSKAAKRYWADPVLKEKMTVGSAAAWTRPDVRAKHLAAVQSPEAKARVSEQMKRRWAENSDFKAAIIAASRAYHNLPSNKIKKSERMKELWGDEAWRARRRTPSGRILEATTDLIARVEKLVPRYLPPPMRADVCQDVLMLLFDGTAKATDLEDALQQALSAHRKLFPDLHRAPRSIDAPIAGTHGLTIAGTL